MSVAPLTSNISRRSFIAIGGAAATVTALSTDELAWANDSHGELSTLIDRHSKSRALENVLGDVLDDIGDDPAMPIVRVKMSEIRPWPGLSGITFLYSDLEINEHFDDVIRHRRTWAGPDSRIEADVERSRSNALGLMQERMRAYEDWCTRVDYNAHEQRYESACAQTDSILRAITSYPCRCLRDASAKAQFLIDFGWVFDSRPHLLREVLTTIVEGGAANG